MIRNKVFYPVGGNPPRSSKEDCELCGQTYSYYSLRRCFRCRKYFCEGCIIEDTSENRNIVCLECARKLILTNINKKRHSNRFLTLSLYLSKRAKYTRWVKICFSEIEGMINRNLPSPAFETLKWWTNNKGNSLRGAWLNIGWKVAKVNLEERIVTFSRQNIVEGNTNRRKKRKFALSKHKPLRKKKPSLTHIAKIQARAKNMAKYGNKLKKHRGLKTRSYYEKRFYKDHEYPQREAKIF